MPELDVPRPLLDRAGGVDDGQVELLPFSQAVEHPGPVRRGLREDDRETERSVAGPRAQPFRGGALGPGRPPPRHTAHRADGQRRIERDGRAREGHALRRRARAPGERPRRGTARLASAVLRLERLHELAEGVGGLPRRARRKRPVRLLRAMRARRADP